MRPCPSGTSNPKHARKQSRRQSVIHGKPISGSCNSTRFSLAYPTVLARYAVAQIKDGRKVGGKLNVHDVSSQYAQQQKGFQLERLDQFDSSEDAWLEVCIEDKHSGPAEVATTKIDFTAWLKSLPFRVRRIAKLLATGEKTSIVAEKFNLSPGRISQLRRELAQSWKKFHGEPIVQPQKQYQDDSFIPAA